jgi:hypothetical protein
VVEGFCELHRFVVNTPIDINAYTIISFPSGNGFKNQLPDNCLVALSLLWSISILKIRNIFSSQLA